MKLSKKDKQLLLTAGAILAPVLLFAAGGRQSAGLSYLGKTGYPRGMRNNNPGNIRISNTPWQGKISLARNTDGAFEQFENYMYGIRAMIKLVRDEYMQRRNLRTIRQILNRYAPPSENVTSAYVTFVANQAGFSPDQQLGTDKNTLQRIIIPMAFHENGREAITPGQFSEAWAASLSGIGAIVPSMPPGKTPCLDGKFSTIPHGPGVCSYHGGSWATKTRKTVKTEKRKLLPEKTSVVTTQTETLPLNYWKIDQNGKAELHFSYGDYKALDQDKKKKIKAYFLWSRPRAAWVSKGAWDGYMVQNIIKDLGFPLVGKEDRFSFEERIEQKTDYAERRSERRDRQAQKAEEKAKQLMSDRERYRGDISFWTQPIINSASGRSFQNYRERVINNYWKGTQLLSKADRLRELSKEAERAAQNQQFKKPAYVWNRIKEAEKEFKTLFEWVPGYMEKAAQSGDFETMIKAETAQDRMNLAAQKLAYFTEIWDNLNAQGLVFDKERLKGAEYVKRRGTWYKVFRLNPTTVTHSWFAGDWKSKYSEIQDAVFPGDNYTVEPTHVKGNFKITRSGASIGAIYPKPPRNLIFYRCNDGTYSTTGACNWHGGRKDDAPVKYQVVKKSTSTPFLPASSAAPVQNTGVTLVPIQTIREKREWFQNRAAAYSERSVNNIVEAVQAGAFRWVNFDPVTLWADPTGKLFVLSGHSRLEAFNRLCKARATAEGRDFCNIPAKIADVSLDEAKRIALESNTLSTKETDLERAQYYRNLRLREGKSLSELRDIAKRLEGNNATKILAFSFLNPAGRTHNALVALENADQTSRGNIANIARWIGNARMSTPQLTDRHENELYEWLVDQRGYGTSKGQISNELEFKNRLASIINKRTQFGVLDETLNIQSAIYRSPVEAEYDQQINAAREQVTTLEKQLKDKVTELARRGASEKQVQEITAGLEASLRRARVNLQNLLLAKGKVQEAAKNELSLFGIKGFTRRRLNGTC